VITSNAATQARRIEMSIDAYYVPNDNNEAEIHHKARYRALIELLAEIDENGMDTVSQITGTIINNIEELKQILEG